MKRSSVKLLIVILFSFFCIVLVKNFILQSPITNEKRIRRNETIPTRGKIEKLSKGTLKPTQSTQTAIHPTNLTLVTTSLPSSSEKPQIPTQSIQSIQSTQPTQPIQPTQPTQPTQSTQSTPSIHSTQGTIPIPSSTTKIGHFPWKTSREPLFAPLEPERLLLEANETFDSQLFYFRKDPGDYRVCHMRDVCFDSWNYYFIIEDDETREYYNQQQKLCYSNVPQKQGFCRCFLKRVYPIFIKSLSELRDYTLYQENMWVSDQWVESHHVYHYMQQRVLFHSIFTRETEFNLTNIDRIALVKNPSPMTKLEEIVYNATISQISSPIKNPPLFQKNIPHPICVPQVSTSYQQGLFTRAQKVMKSFKESVNSYLGLDIKYNEKCPPPITYILIRSEPNDRLRRMSNQDLVEKLLKETFKIQNLEVVTTSQMSTIQEQIELFSRFGLMLASHSSQLVFTIFSQPGAAIIEVVPTYFNSDFSHIGDKSGVYHQFSVGAKIKNNTALTSAILDCNKNFGDCNGEEQCYSTNVSCSSQIRTDIKQPNFEADLDILKTILMKSIKHLDSLCDGHWPGRGNITV